MNMKQLTKKNKLVLGAAGASIVAIAAVLGVWQPWVQPDPAEDQQPSGVQGEVLPPAEPEEELTLNVGGERVPCTVFAGDGWQIYVPKEWQVEERETDIALHSGDGASVIVERSAESLYSGDFVSAYPIQMEQGAGVARVFYSAGPSGVWQVTCQAEQTGWAEAQKLMTAMVRTMSVGEERIFSGLSPVASEPDWQVYAGDTLLWMDKDAFLVDDVLKAEVEAGMLAWDRADKVNFTGQYRMDDLTWAGSYTCLTGEGYVDIFRSQVWYEIAEGKEETLSQQEGDDIVDGWLRGGEPVVVLFHDGSAVAGSQILWENDAAVGGAAFAAELVKD